MSNHEFPFALLVVLIAASVLSAQSPILYGSDVQQDALGSIDRTNGTWTLIGSLGPAIS
jgi:hypothetical protein